MVVRSFYLCLFLTFLLGSAFAQTIHLRNASFEGEPQDATVPMGWFPCQPRTTPDILPGFWGVYQEAYDGDTFVGLITRPDGSYESISQRLSEPLSTGDCFGFSVYLAHARTYSGYNAPIRLRIWAGTRKCDRDQLLLDTDPVEHQAWKKYSVKFTAESALNYLIFEAYFPEGQPAAVGNILLDNCSAIKKCPRA